jgi:single-strand DNA-binding protein
MAGDTLITLAGNLTSDLELRYTPSGHAIASFTVASTPRTFDKNTNAWKDQETLFMRCSVWRNQAESAAESLTRGTRVVVIGRLKQRSYETREGEKKTVIEVDVEEVAASLKNATVKVSRAERGSSGGGASGTPVDDPWGSAPAASADDDAPPF